MKVITITFETTDRRLWFKNIANNVQNASFVRCGDIVHLNFSAINDIHKFSPAHIVSLACFIEYLVQNKCKVVIEGTETNAVSQYLWHTLRMQEYWNLGQNFVPAVDNSIFNLWRIVEREKEMHSRRIHDYLKQNFFKNKDLSAVRNSLDEAYYNIFDHAAANGNAYSFIKFDEKSKKLFVAVCDFGIGIAQSVKKAVSDITSDSIAIKKAMEYKFTTRSQTHNMGMGLGNIKDTCTDDDVLCIISNSGLLMAKRDNMIAQDEDYDFPGTLIYYELSLSHFEDEEIIDNFAL